MIWQQLWMRGPCQQLHRSYLVEPIRCPSRRDIVIGFDPEFASHLSLVDHAQKSHVVADKLAESAT